ncbi:hypothetical protein PG993_005756 [Apiospora rasikravindrae]|uniref:non-specific serine/threonine protein kinase n=1 Tax=Apiospora rasikravindrae TaxID=990691 RepID=A0ABR1TBG2_9PEZI
MQVDDDVEDIRAYKEGGYAVVEIGDVLKRKYEVVDKLGHSEYATVWLCWIQGTQWPRTEWVAVKVFKAEYYKDAPSEETMRKFDLEKKGGWEKEWAGVHVAMALTEFSIIDLNGKHKCLVMPVMGPSLESLELTHRPTLKGYLYEVALALQYLHRKKMAHGQVTPRNIYFQLDMKSSRIRIDCPADVQQALGLEERKKQTVEKAPRRPRHQVRPADLARLEPLGRIVLYPPSSPVGVTHVSPDVLGVPDWFYAPEVLLNRCTVQPGGDVWSFCCTILHLYAKCTLGLVDANVSNRLFKTHLRILERHLGPIGPGPPLFSNVKGRQFDTEDQYEQWLSETTFPPWTTPLTALLGSSRFRRQLYPKLAEPDAGLLKDDAEALSTLLEEALCYDHSKRSIDHVLWSPGGRTYTPAEWTTWSTGAKSQIHQDIRITIPRRALKLPTTKRPAKRPNPSDVPFRRSPAPCRPSHTKRAPSKSWRNDKEEATRR